MSDENSVVETTTEEQQPSNEQQQGRHITLPDDHPLVKTLEAQKATIKELKEKAARLAQIEDEQKTEAERVAERLATAEAEAASVPQKVAEQLRGYLIGLHGISNEDAELFLTANDPELLLKQVTRLVSQAPKPPSPNPQQGNPSQARGGTLAAGRERYAAHHK